jgi:hypothetical protein
MRASMHVVAHSPLQPLLADQARPGALLSLGHRAADAADLQLHLPPLQGAGIESWCGGPVQAQTTDTERLLRADGEHLMAAWQIDEDAAGGLERVTEQVYARIGVLLRESGYPHALKIWHYFADINAGDADTERYRRFCQARARVLPPERPLPAATAIGTAPGTPFTVLLLASRHAGRAIENPRQVPAWEYPRCYGPASPSFSRAMLTADGALLVSGTAAVVGHRSQHPEDVRAQFAEVLANLAALRDEAQTVGGRPLHPAYLKIFVRRAEDADRIARDLAASALAECPVLLVQGAISRRELLVESEAWYRPD